jgi:hypothetical protein
MTPQQMTDKISALQKQNDRQDEIIKQFQKQEKFSKELSRQDCGFNTLNSTSWRESKVADTLKTELDTWEKRGTGETFYQYMYKEYAPGLAPSQTHCNGRGSCGVSSVFQRGRKCID